MNTQQGVALFSVLASFAAFGSVAAQELDPDLYSEGVPAILNQGPAGTATQSEVRFLEGPPSIDNIGPAGRPAKVVVRDGEGGPAIDRIGAGEFAGFETSSEIESSPGAGARR